MLRAILSVVLAGVLAPAALACPTDGPPRPAGVALMVHGTSAPPISLTAVELGRLPATHLTQRQTVSSGASAASERSTVWSGVLLRDVLTHAGFGIGNDRGARTATVEAVATDGYRAVFSWGELFNSGTGEQTLVIVGQDGRPLDAVAGPLALRSLADVRPGPRHVRNLCALLVRR